MLAELIPLNRLFALLKSLKNSGSGELLSARYVYYVTLLLTPSGLNLCQTLIFIPNIDSSTEHQ